MKHVTVPFVFVLVFLSVPQVVARSTWHVAHGHRFEFQRPAMGTVARIVLYARDEESARELSRAAFARIAELDARLTDYGDTSELIELGRGAGGPARVVSDDLFRVLDAAYRMAERTGGAFDVTIGPVSQMWRRARAGSQPPDSGALAAAQQLVGYRHLVLSPEERTARLTRRGMQLDLGGIGKGFAADEALKTLRDKGARAALVALGGDVVVGDAPPQRAGWQIAIAPLGTTDSKPQTKTLVNAAVSTSGDAEQFLEYRGVRHSHLTDPSTGAAKTGRRGVTVVARDGTTADALSTAVGVMGVERGFAVVEDLPGAAALYVEVTPAGRKEYRSRRW